MAVKYLGSFGRCSPCVCASPDGILLVLYQHASSDEVVMPRYGELEWEKWRYNLPPHLAYVCLIKWFQAATEVRNNVEICGTVTIPHHHGIGTGLTAMHHIASASIPVGASSSS